MEQSLDKNIELKDRILSFCRKNKYKIYFFITILIVVIISLTFLNTYKKNNNKKIAEKYVQAGIYLSAGKKEIAQKIYEEIILSENKFYSILSLNSIIEQNLLSDKDKILEYFEILEKINFSEEQLDLITLKKSLFLLKFSETEKANNLLKKLKNKKSDLELIIDEIIIK